MNRLSIKYLGLLLAGVAVGFSLALGKALVAGPEARPADPAGLSVEESRLLADVLDRIRREYVEPVTDRQLVENAVRGMLAELDSHSKFLTPSEYEDVKISTTGNYSGVGLEIEMSDGRVTVVTPLDGSAAERAGLRSGDVILTIDGLAVDNRDVSDTVLRMRGLPGTHVRIGVAREGEAEALDFSLERRKLQLHSVHAQLLEEDYGYVRVSQFSETTASDLRRAIEQLNAEVTTALRGLVVDLRGNPGGLLTAAVEVADLFLDSGVIVTASGRTRDASFRHEAKAGDILAGAALAVLVNGTSASAAEIVAGALQDNHRAVVIGRPTFGKGSVQTVMPLANGRAMKLTTSRYLTPSGVSIQDQGIRPDLELAEDVMASGPLRLKASDNVLQSDPPVRQALDALRNTGRVVQSRLD